MRDVGRRYVQYINYTYRRSGTLWEGRFKSILVDAQRYFFTCCRYIELNPVRAGIVTRPEEYRWSSHCHYALGREDHLVTAHEEYQALGNDETARRQAYRELFSGHLDENVLTEIRGAVDRGWPLGSERFKDEIEAALQRAARPPRRGRPSRRMGASEM
jgi:putative transposase